MGSFAYDGYVAEVSLVDGRHYGLGGVPALEVEFGVSGGS
jgi:hypothetical protein